MVEGNKREDKRASPGYGYGYGYAGSCSQKQLIYAMPKLKSNPSRSGPHSPSKQKTGIKAAARPSERELTLVLSLAVHITRLYCFHKLHY